MNLDAIDEIVRQRRLQDAAHVGMVVPEAREALAGVEVQVRTPVSVIEIRASGANELRVETDDPQHVDKCRIDVARRETERLVGAHGRVREHAERIGDEFSRFVLHDHRPRDLIEQPC